MNKFHTIDYLQLGNAKQQGYKTEPAFCKILGIEGNPYEQLIAYGKEKGYVRSNFTLYPTDHVSFSMFVGPYVTFVRYVKSTNAVF